MKQIPLTQDKVALVDDQDYKWLSRHRWYARNDEGRNWYAVGARPWRVGMHRVILGAPKNRDVDHVNGNGLDNRRANLRLCTETQNQQNRHLRSGRSRFKGVQSHRGKHKWEVRITVKGRKLYLGSFESETDAAMAYDVAATEHFGQFANLNFGQAGCRAARSPEGGIGAEPGEAGRRS